MKGTVLNWREGSHYEKHTKPCRVCGGPTNLRDDNSLPCHKVCAEQEADSPAVTR